MAELPLYVDCTKEKEILTLDDAIKRESNPLQVEKLWRTYGNDPGYPYPINVHSTI